MSASVNIGGGLNGSFLSSLLDHHMHQQSNAIIGINDLDEKVLRNVLSFMSIKERIGVRSVCRKFRSAVDGSIQSVNFYNEGLDMLDDEKLKGMLEPYESHVKSLTFDLYKSTFAEEISQHPWRQSIISLCALFPNLSELNIVVCNRHRLRDLDLNSIFETCKQLKKLCVDAQFINGHYFKRAPVTLQHLELEMCYRISEASFKTILYRLRKLRVLHVSQLLILSDAHVQSLVKNLRNLECLSIVSHVDTKYDNLTGGGLADLGKLRCLRTLCLEGLSAVTDRTLNVISDAAMSPSCATLASLSLAFCYNLSMHGLKNLARIPQLQNLNLDGITKRDISIGLEKIAQQGRLVRLFLAERTNVAPESLLAVVKASPHLRLLDISTNEEIFNWVFADQLLTFWTSSGRPPLTILTDEHLGWNLLHRQNPHPNGPDAVRVVHINPAIIPPEEMFPDSVVCTESTSTLPPALLAPFLRTGNRYRLLWAPLGPSRMGEMQLFENGEDGLSHADFMAEHHGEYMEEMKQRALMQLSQDHEEESQEDESDGMDLEARRNAAVADHWNQAFLQGKQEELAPMTVAPPHFSPGPVSLEGDPHTKDWSMDVNSLVLRTYAYEDGAMIRNMKVLTGVIARDDGTAEDVSHSIGRIDPELRERYRMQSLPAASRRGYTGTRTSFSSSGGEPSPGFDGSPYMMPYPVSQSSSFVGRPDAFHTGKGSRRSLHFFSDTANKPDREWIRPATSTRRLPVPPKTYAPAFPTSSGNPSWRHSSDVPPPRRPFKFHRDDNLHHSLPFHSYGEHGLVVDPSPDGDFIFGSPPRHSASTSLPPHPDIPFYSPAKTAKTIVRPRSSAATVQDPPPRDSLFTRLPSTLTPSTPFNLPDFDFNVYHYN